MIKHYTEKALADELKKLTVIADTREQVNEHLFTAWDKKKVPYITRKLDVGDYSCQIDDMSFERSVAVERKHDLDEICGNLTADRDRFEREFMRAKAWGTKVFLIIENSSWDDVYSHNYRSKLDPKSLLASLAAWQVRYDVTIIFCSAEVTPRLIITLLHYAVREELLGKR